MMLQPENSDIIISMINEVEAHEAKSNWKIRKWVKSTIRKIYIDAKQDCFVLLGF